MDASELAQALQLHLCVRNAAEAASAVRAGAGGVEVMSAAPEVVRAVVTRLRLLRDGVVVGAGIGRLAVPTVSAVRLRVLRMADCGVDRVRVPVPARPSSVLLLTQLGQLARDGVPVTPLLQVPLAFGDGQAWAQRLSLAGQQGFAAVLLDVRGTDAQGLDLWQQPTAPVRLLNAVAALQRQGVRVGLLAAPRRADLPQLLRWRVDEAVVDCGRDDPREGRLVDTYQFDQWIESLKGWRRAAVAQEVRHAG